MECIPQPVNCLSQMMAERGDFMMVHEPFSYLAEVGYADIGVSA
jgi:hypothetical protein